MTTPPINHPPINVDTVSTGFIPTPTHRCESKGFRIPLSLLITVPFLLNTFGIVGLIGWLSFRNGHHAVTLLANQFHRKVTEQVQDRLHSYLELPYTLNQLNANSIELGQIEPNDEIRVQAHFWKQLQNFPRISNIYFATTSGKYWGVRRIKDRFAIENTNSTFMTDNFGRPQTLLMAKNSFNLTERPWYQTVVETRQSIWTEVYTDSMTEEPAITSIRPVYQENGELQGVLGISMLLGDINQFLQNTKVSANGQTLIIEPSGKLVATSNLNVEISSQGNKSERIFATQSQDKLTRKVAEQLELMPATNDNEIRRFDFEGESYALQVGKLQNDSGLSGLNWRIVVAVPASDFMSQIKENSVSTVMLCLIALGLNAILGIIAARRISRPITQLSQASQSIANGNLDQKVEYDCVIKELVILANSFNQMSRQMKRSHTRLEEYSQLLVQKVDERTYALQQEILEHEFTEAALRESEEKFAKAFRSSPDGMALLSNDTYKHIPS